MTTQQHCREPYRQGRGGEGETGLVEKGSVFKYSRGEPSLESPFGR